MATQTTARGRIHCWEGGSLWIGEAAGDARLHDHHALQLSLAFSGTIRFRTPPGDWRAFAAALVPPHLTHEFAGTATFTAQIFIEPETVEGRALLARFGVADITELPRDEVARHAGKLRVVDPRRANAADLESAALALVEGLAGAHRPAVLDPRIDRTIRSLRKIERPITLAEAARRAALSPGRFRHLFVEQTGQSFRSYQLWMRLQRAIDALSRGDTATEAAHAAGFADAAHLTRTFRKMMGITPAAVEIG